MVVQRRSDETITFRLPKAEKDTLKDYCDKVNRLHTDVLREFIRSLPTYKED